MQYYSIKGIVLALLSGILFTANNFLVNRYSVSACHLVLVRTLLQMLVYTIYCLVRSEPLLPGPPKQKMFILLQGQKFYIVLLLIFYGFCTFVVNTCTFSIQVLRPA